MASSIGRGMIAGFAATVVLSAMMVLKQSMGIMPALNPIAMMSDVLGASTPSVSWLMHFMIGTVLWGAGFAIVAPVLSGPYILRGVIFAGAAWLMMMVIVMPMAGSGFFGLGLGVMAPVVTLVMHVVFGLVLGGVFGLLAGDRAEARSYPR